MTDIAQLVDLMQKQIEMHWQQIDKQEERHLQQEERHCWQMEALIKRVETGSPIPAAPAASVPSFSSFDRTSELWRDYLAKFNTFVGANSITQKKIAQVSPTNQTSTNTRSFAH